MGVDPRKNTLHHPDKTLFPDNGLTKRALADYYEGIAPRLLRYLADRPVTLHRFPEGIDREGFYQQNAPEHFPDWVRVAPLPRAGSASVVRHIVCDDAATLVYLVDLATIEFHRWPARLPGAECPDRLIFDLDPPDADFEPVRDAARRIVDLVQHNGGCPAVMTTGSRGLHVVVPVRPTLGFDAVRAIARRLAEHLARHHPERLTTEHYRRRRRGRLYLDILRNAYGQTAVAPGSVRARPGAPVAAPIHVDELDDPDLGPQRYDTGGLFERGEPTPWSDLDRHAIDPRRLDRRRP